MPSRVRAALAHSDVDASHVGRHRRPTRAAAAKAAACDALQLCVAVTLWFDFVFFVFFVEPCLGGFVFFVVPSVLAPCPKVR